MTSCLQKAPKVVVGRGCSLLNFCNLAPIAHAAYSSSTGKTSRVGCYDSSLRDHSDSQMALNSLKQIASTLGREETSCRRVWKNSIDGCKSLKQSHENSGDPGNNKAIKNNFSFRVSDSDNYSTQIQYLMVCQCLLLLPGSLLFQ